MKKSFFGKFLLFLFLPLFLVSNIYSGFYADIIIDVDSSGFVNIGGKTNYNNFLNISNSQDFASKKAGVWTLNISSDKNETFDDFIYELVLPSNSQISYMKTTPNFRIENIGDRIKIIGLGSNKPFTILLQYSIAKKNPIDSLKSVNYLWFFGIGLLFVLVFLMIYYGRKLLKKETNIENIQDEIEDVLEESDILHPDVVLKNKKYDFKNFPQRQQEIIKLLKKKGDLTQEEIREEMKIPKSSVSRNIKSLEIKGIVKIKDFGRYNKIILNEKKLE